MLLRLNVIPLPLGGILRKNVRDQHLAEMVRPPYLADTFDRSANHLLSVSFVQTGRNPADCSYGIGIGENCGVGSIGDLGCQFRTYGGPIGADKWDYIASDGFLTFEGALVEVTMPGTGSYMQPLHIQSSVFQIVSVNSSDDLSQLFQLGSWRDSLPPIADTVTLRFHAMRSSGECVFGTAFLPHQDKGSLDTFLIVDLSEFGSLTSAPTSAPTVTPDDDMIGPLGTIWIIAIVAGVVVIGRHPVSPWSCDFTSR